MGILVVDLDGTLARCDTRLHFIQKTPKDWDGFHRAGLLAEPFKDVVELVNIVANAGYGIVIVTGRNGRYRVGTEMWLSRYVPRWNQLIMRSDTDFRSDVEYKGEVFDRLKLENVLAIIDDRDSVIAMARLKGFTAIQPNAGAF